MEGQLNALGNANKQNKIPPRKASKKATHVPWSENDSEIVYTFYSDRPLPGIINSFHTTTLGTVKIVLKDLVTLVSAAAASRGGGGDDGSITFVDDKDGYLEIEKWFPIVPDVQIKQSNYDDLGIFESSFVGSTTSYLDSTNSTANVLWAHLRISLDTRNSKQEASTEEQANASAALTGILFDAAVKKKNTISTLLNLKDTVETVQNLMRIILNYIETVKNLIQFVAPTKSKPLYYALIGLWVATVFIPGRYLILALGLYQFLFKFVPEPEEKPIAIKIANFIESVPNDDDIDQVFDWEKKSYKERMEASRNQMLRISRLNLLFPVLWQGLVHVKCSKHEEWEKSYLLLQHKRMVWWSREGDVEEGKPPQGQIILFGHTGVTQPSLIDVRESGADERQLIVVFGRDTGCRPIRATVLCSDSIACRKLEEQIKLTIVGC